MIPPTIYRRSIDSTYNCVVRTAAGKPCHRGTRCHHQDAAAEFARLLQRDIQRRAENGDLLPPIASDPQTPQMIYRTLNILLFALVVDGMARTRKINPWEIRIIQ